MKWLFSFVFVLGIYGQAVAQLEMPDRSLIMEANKAFNDGDLDKARDNYKEILEMGFVSGDLFFNLGNIYFKKGDLASQTRTGVAACDLLSCGIYLFG